MHFTISSHKTSLLKVWTPNGAVVCLFFNALLKKLRGLTKLLIISISMKLRLTHRTAVSDVEGSNPRSTLDKDFKFASLSCCCVCTF